jgi:hypothetical protein
MSADGSSWYTGENGKPMVKVSSGAEEKIGLPNYSNVTIYASVTRFVEDTPKSITNGLKACVDVCEELLAQERKPVLEMVQAK